MVSIIVPVYNTEKYLPQCLDSVLDQTVSDFELLLIDDGSTDASGALCDAYAARDSRIRVFHQENRGLSAARNLGLDAAKGQYLSFVDSDDWLCPEMLEMMLARLEQTGADMALCNLRRVPGEVTAMPGGCLTRAEFLEKLSGQEAWYYVIFPNKLCRRALFDGLCFPEGFLHEDEAIIHRLAARCSRIAVEPRPLYCYRRRVGSITGVGGHIPDKLAALADRIRFSREMGWEKLYLASSLRFSEMFLEFYQGRNRRMENALSAILPQLWRAGSVKWRHKCYLTLIWFSPELYVSFRRWKRGGKS